AARVWSAGRRLSGELFRRLAPFQPLQPLPELLIPSLEGRFPVRDTMRRAHRGTQHDEPNDPQDDGSDTQAPEDDFKRTEAEQGEHHNVTSRVPRHLHPSGTDP